MRLNISPVWVRIARPTVLAFRKLWRIGNDGDLFDAVADASMGGQKDPRAGPRVLCRTRIVRRLSDLLCGLGNGLLDRLVGTARQVDIHLTELRRLGNVCVKRLLGVMRLDLECLLE